jgi:hypothetical protein
VTRIPKSNPKQNTGAVVQAGVRQPGRAPNSPATGYRVGAISFLAGVRALATTVDFDTLISCHVLAAFAIECALKSFLSLHGVGQKKLQTHDLVHLWEQAAKFGLAIPPDASFECKVLSALSTGPLFYIRYRAGANGAVVLPAPILIMVVEELQQKTEAAFPV